VCDLWDPAGVNSIDFSKIKKDCDLLREYNCQVDIERINYKQYTNKTYYSCDDGGFLNVIDNDDIFICYDIFHTENGATEKRIYARMYIITCLISIVLKTKH
jgi:hydroxypyruvate isomerase